MDHLVPEGRECSFPTAIAKKPQACSHWIDMGHVLIPDQITVHLTHEVGGRFDPQELPECGGFPKGKWFAISRKNECRYPIRKEDIHLWPTQEKALEAGDRSAQPETPPLPSSRLEVGSQLWTPTVFFRASASLVGAQWPPGGTAVSNL